jgi:hypothetical protein
MKRFLRRNWVEVLGIVGLILGFILVIERYTIRGWMSENVGGFRERFMSGLNQLYEQLTNFIFRVGPSTWIGILFIVGCVILVGLRLRYRFLNSYRWNDLSCPRCKSELERIHRSFFQRLLSKTILPEGRLYQCTNESCNWVGMKRVESGHRRKRSDSLHE